MNDVSECAAAKSVSAYVILNPKGVHVATLRAHHGGTCTVNVFQVGDVVNVRSYEAAGFRQGDMNRDKYLKAAHDAFGFQVGRAGGGGYDKFTAALSGMIIDGHKMTVDNHAEGPNDVPARFQSAGWLRPGQFSLQ